MLLNISFTTFPKHLSFPLHIQKYHHLVKINSNICILHEAFSDYSKFWISKTFYLYSALMKSEGKNDNIQMSALITS